MHNNKASNESKTTASTGSETGEKEESNSKETTSTSEIEKEIDTTNKTNKEQLDETKDTGNGKKVLQNSAHTQTQSARENSGKENTEQAQIMETMRKKKTYEITEEKKPVKDVKEQSIQDQQLPKVTIRK